MRIPARAQRARAIRDMLIAAPGRLVTYTELQDGAGIEGEHPRRTIAVHMVAVRAALPRGYEIVGFDARGYMLLMVPTR